MQYKIEVRPLATTEIIEAIGIRSKAILRCKEMPKKVVKNSIKRGFFARLFIHNPSMQPCLCFD